MREEEQRVEEAMQSRMQMLREQRRRQLEERKKELMKHQDGTTARRISDLKDQYERELGDLEAAIRREEAQQLSKLRKALLTRKIAKEAKKREAERAKASKASAELAASTIGNRLVQEIKSARQPARTAQEEAAASAGQAKAIREAADGDDLLR